MKNRSFSNLRKDVIKKGLCTGCGTCVGVCPAGVIQFDFDLEEPVLEGSCVTSCGICYEICPGKDIPLLKLEKKFLGVARNQQNELWGVAIGFLKGFSKISEIRQIGASGGLTTALLIYALEQGEIDGAIVTMMDPEKPWRVKPTLAKTKTELIKAAKSKYVICPNNMVLKEARGVDRVALVGLPCHIHGIRKLQCHNGLGTLAKKVVLVLGVFCGSNWPYKATEHMIREISGVSFGEIERFEYRGGTDSQDVKILTNDKKEITITPSEQRLVFHFMVVRATYS